MFGSKVQELETGIKSASVAMPFGEKKGFNDMAAQAKNTSTKDSLMISTEPDMKNLALGQQKSVVTTAKHSKQNSMSDAFKTAQDFKKATTNLPANKKAKDMKENPSVDKSMFDSTMSAAAPKMKSEEDAADKMQVIKEANDEQKLSNSGSQVSSNAEPIGPQSTMQSQQQKALPQKECAEPTLDNTVNSPEQTEIINDAGAASDITHVLIDQKELVMKTLNSISLEEESLDSLKLDSSDPKYHSKKIAQTFRKRLGKFIEKEMTNMTQDDKVNFADPQNLSEFSQPIFNNMIAEEKRFMVDPAYISKVQTEIRDTSRAFLLEWIIDVHRKFRLRPECLYVTQLIIDQYLSQVKIQKSQLHLLGVATLLIATKYEEIYPPELRELLAISENKFNKEQVLTMEKEILVKLGFILTAPSAYRFLERYRQLNKLYQDKEVFFYAQYVLEVSILDASLLQFTPSQLAASALILSATQLKKTDGWNEHMERFTGYTKASLKKPIEEVRSFATEINPKFISTLRYKFSKAEYMKVANHQFNF